MVQAFLFGIPIYGLRAAFVHEPAYFLNMGYGLFKEKTQLGGEACYSRGHETASSASTPGVFAPYEA